MRISDWSSDVCSSDLVVPESGQGALGPVLLPLYNIYRDYRNHPSLFRKMERFLCPALDHSVEFDQPRMWSTKGQTLRTFLTQTRSEEHTSELQSLMRISYAVLCLTKKHYLERDIRQHVNPLP